MKTKVQEFAELVAADVLGVPYADLSTAMAAGSGQVAGIDIVTITALIELIMNMVMEIIENCPNNDKAVREAVKSPTIWQRARVRRMVKDNCDCCAVARWRTECGRIADAMISLAAKSDDATIDQAIDQVRGGDDNWLL